MLQSSTLADQGGVWCAHCLQYIEAGQGRFHFQRIFPEPIDADLFGEPLAGDWVVPVCKGGFCEHELSTLANDVGRVFQRLRSLDHESQKACAVQFFDAGALGLSLLLDIALCQDLRAIGDTEGYWRLAEHVVSAATSVPWSQRAIATLVDFEHLPDRPMMLMNAAVWSASFAPPRTKPLFERAERLVNRLPPPLRENARVLRNRRFSQMVMRRSEATSEEVGRAVEAARLAIKEAPNDFSRATALTLDAVFAHRLNDLSRMRFQCERVLQSRTSFIFRPQVSTHSALADLEHGGDREVAYQRLVIAQYVFCMLGVMPQAPFHSERIGINESRVFTPGHILMTSPLLKPARSFRKERMQELREEILGSSAAPSSIWSEVRQCLWSDKCFPPDVRLKACADHGIGLRPLQINQSINPLATAGDGQVNKRTWRGPTQTDRLRRHVAAGASDATSNECNQDPSQFASVDSSEGPVAYDRLPTSGERVVLTIMQELGKVAMTRREIIDAVEARNAPELRDEGERRYGRILIALADMGFVERQGRGGKIAKKWRLTARGLEWSDTPTSSA